MIKKTELSHNIKSKREIGSVESFCKTKDGSVWIATTVGLYKLNPSNNRAELYQPTSSLKDVLANQLNSLTEDKEGNLWAGTTFAGLLKFDSKSKEFYRYKNETANQNSLPINGLLTVYTDRSGIIWIGYWTGGISKWDRQKWKFPLYNISSNQEDILNNNNVNTIYEDISRNLWIGTQRGLSNAIGNFPNWSINYSIQDFVRVSDQTYFLNRKEFPIDFPVWHNRDDVAQGKDAVVEAALEWMNNLVYGHDVNTDNKFYLPGNDTCYISAIVENPNLNNVAAKIFIEDLKNTFVDSILLTPTGASDIWEGEWILPNIEDIYKMKMKTIDNTVGNSFTFSNMQRISTAGPVVLDSISFYKGVGDWYFLKPFVTNKGNSATITNAEIKFLCDDPWVASFSTSVVPLPDIEPGATVGSINWATINYIDSLFPGYFNIKVEIMSGEWTYWTDSMRVPLIIPGVEEENLQPMTYDLEQNYPNPFNPTTTIKYQIPTSGNISIKVYDILGNEVAKLVDGYMETGKYEVEFDANSLASGVYIYRLSVNDFVNVKKMVLLK